MSRQPSDIRYALIWIWLIVLLAAGTLISTLPIPKSGAALLILGVSLVKAILVAFFYMQLKSERLAPIWIVALFPFLLIGLAAFLVLVGLALS